MNVLAVRSLRFPDLLSRAFEQLPEHFDLSRAGGATGGYRVESLEAVDDASEAWIGTSHEVLMRNLFDAIYETAHAVAARLPSVRTVDLPASDIRMILDRRLRDTSPDAGWRPSDHALVRRYFEANAQAA